MRDANGETRVGLEIFLLRSKSALVIMMIHRRKKYLFRRTKTRQILFCLIIIVIQHDKHLSKARGAARCWMWRT
jgi:hypothetical protein